MLNDWTLGWVWRLNRGDVVMYELLGKLILQGSELYGVWLGENNLHFKRIVDESDHLLLQNLFESMDGIRIPLSYLKQGRAFLCINTAGEAQGGFALIDTGPYRSLQQLPTEFGQLSRLNITEITALCLSAGDQLRRLRFWSYMIGHALSGPANELIYAVDSKKVALRERIFNHIRIHTLYEGAVTQLDGMESSTTEAVEMTDKAQLLQGFVKLAYREVQSMLVQHLNLTMRSTQVKVQANPTLQSLSRSFALLRDGALRRS